MYIGQANLIRINSLHENLNLMIKSSPTASQTSYKAFAVCFVGSLSFNLKVVTFPLNTAISGT